MQVKKIIITGASGFLGKHLGLKLIEHGYAVKGIDLRPNDAYDTVIADVRDRQAMDRELSEADLVFHLASLIEAGESVKFPEKFFDNNVGGTLTVLESMRKNGLQMIAISSSAAVYGEPIRVPIQEDDRTIPINPYGTTKLTMEGLLSSYVYAHGFSGVGLRYFNLYGPGEHHQPETHAIPRFIEQISRGQEVTIWGDGQYGRDYLYIDDVVDAHLKAITLMEQQPQRYHYCNLSTERVATVLDIVELLQTVMAQTAKLKYFPPRPGDPRVLVADASKAKKLLGWEAQVSLEEGLKRTVEYFQSLNQGD